ncbi:MAG: hypothetical protein GF332_02595 [Candidatus Moranbacteria bacterium]|nr:hypothetical protein [Candidatus Moranbacteria bacterium]
MNPRIQKPFKFLLLLIIFGLVVFFSVNFWVRHSTQEFIKTNIQDLPEQQTALVLGALVNSDGSLSHILFDRCQAAIKLYKTGKVKRILVSADNSRVNYNETEAAVNYIISQGVPSQHVYSDYAGFDTYDSLYRARDIFQVDSLIVCTQAFHQPRTIYLARSLGLNAYGYPVDLRVYTNIRNYKFREYFAVIKAFLDIITNSKPKYLGETIPIQ